MNSFTSGPCMFARRTCRKRCRQRRSTNCFMWRTGTNRHTDMREYMTTNMRAQNQMTLNTLTSCLTGTYICAPGKFPAAYWQYSQYRFLSFYKLLSFYSCGGSEICLRLLLLQRLEWRRSILHCHRDLPVTRLPLYWHVTSNDIYTFQKHDSISILSSYLL